MTAPINPATVWTGPSGTQYRIAYKGGAPWVHERQGGEWTPTRPASDDMIWHIAAAIAEGV